MEKWDSLHKFSKDLKYKIIFLKLKRKCKNDVKVGVGKMKKKNIFCHFFKLSLNFKAHALKSEINKIIISHFVKFKLQIMSYKIEGTFEKITKFSIPIRI